MNSKYFVILCLILGSIKANPQRDKLNFIFQKMAKAPAESTFTLWNKWQQKNLDTLTQIPQVEELLFTKWQNYCQSYKMDSLRLLAALKTIYHWAPNRILWTQISPNLSHHHRLQPQYTPVQDSLLLPLFIYENLDYKQKKSKAFKSYMDLTKFLSNSTEHMILFGTNPQMMLYASNAPPHFPFPLQLQMDSCIWQGQNTALQLSWNPPYQSRNPWTLKLEHIQNTQMQTDTLMIPFAQKTISIQIHSEDTLCVAIQGQNFRHCTPTLPSSSKISLDPKILQIPTAQPSCKERFQIHAYLKSIPWDSLYLKPTDLAKNLRQVQDYIKLKSLMDSTQSQQIHQQIYLQSPLLKSQILSHKLLPNQVPQALWILKQSTFWDLELAGELQTLYQKRKILNDSALQWMILLFENLGQKREMKVCQSLMVK